MSEKRKVIVFGGSKGIGKCIIDKLEAKGQYEILEISRTSGYDLLDKDFSPPENKTDIFVYCTGVGFFKEEGRKPKNIERMLKLDLEIPIQLTYQIEAEHYIYVGSNSSYFGFRGSEVYCAVKHGILGFARGLRRTGRKVSVVSPGTVDTAFWENSGRPRDDMYQRPEDVANAVMCCIENDADIEEVLIMPYRKQLW